MAEYLLDTDHLSYIQKRHPIVLEHFGQLGPADRILTSVISVGELLPGALLAPERGRRERLLDLYHEVINQMAELVPVTRPVAERFAEVGAALSRQGQPIPINDLWVAAVALTRGAVLVTNDHHFARVESLSLENWTR